jgi:hypothetical protein
MTACQRWRDRRAHYRPAGEVFDSSRASVEVIDEATAKDFTVRHHYAGTYPAARFRVGLFVGGRTSRESLVGVSVFSVPMSQFVVPKWFDGMAPNDGVELGRLVLLDSVAANAESWFVARSFRLLRESIGVHGVLSYSDPIQRVAADGTVVKRGHVGTVYQALNACYRGRSRAQRMILSRDGRVVGMRALSKLRNDEIGAGYAYEQLRGLGAPARKPFEGGAEYIRRALAEGGFRTVRHPGNHTYTWWLGDRARRPAWQAMPYPKAEAQ